MCQLADHEAAPSISLSPSSASEPSSTTDFLEDLFFTVHEPITESESRTHSRSFSCQYNTVT